MAYYPPSSSSLLSRDRSPTSFFEGWLGRFFLKEEGHYNASQEEVT
jgi:hypothetical protein